MGWVGDMQMLSLLVKEGAGPGRWCKGWYESGRGGCSLTRVKGKPWVGSSGFPRMLSIHVLPLIPQTLSMLPTRILRLLEFVGFSGNKVNAHLWVPSICPVHS